MNNNKNIFVSGNAVITVLFEHTDFNTFPRYTDAELPVGSSVMGLTTGDGEALTRALNTTVIATHQEGPSRVLVTDGSFTLNLTASEHNDTTLRLYYGTKGNVDGSYDIESTAASNVTVFYDTVDNSEGYEKQQRFTFNATVTPDGAINNSRGAESGIPLAFTSVGKVRLATIEETE